MTPRRSKGGSSGQESYGRPSTDDPGGGYGWVEGMDPDERVLDHALHEVHDEEEHGDLSERILAAWERGVQGSGIPVFEPMGIARSHPPLPRTSIDEARGQRRRRGWLAAAGLAAAAVLAWVLRTPEVPAPVAQPIVASIPVQYRIGSERLRGDRIPLGATLLTSLEEVHLEFPGAGSVAVAPHSVVDLVSGPWVDAGPVSARSDTSNTGDRVPYSMTLHSGGLQTEHPLLGGFQVRGPIAALDAPAGSEFELELGWELRSEEKTGSWPELPADAMANWSSGFFERGIAADRPNRWLVRLVEGVARVDFAQWSEEVESGAELVLYRDERQGTRLSGADGKEVLTLFESAFSGKYDDPWMGGEYGIWMSRSRLNDALELRPARWSALLPEARSLLKPSNSGPSLRRSMTGYLASAPGDAGVELVRDHWLESPEDFGIDAIIALADRGLPEFVREVGGLLEHWDEDAAYDPVVPAAWFGLRGDDRGITFLLDAVEQPSLGEPLPVFVAASALAALGLPQHAEDLRDRMLAEARSALEADNLMDAAQWALFVEFSDAPRFEDQRLPLAYFGSQFARYIAERRSLVADRVGILAVLDLLESR